MRMFGIIYRPISILIFVFLFLSMNSCFADQLILHNEKQYQEKIEYIGFRILNANELDKRITFFYSSENKVKARARHRLKSIIIYKGLIPYFENDDEIAAVLSLKIAMLADIHRGIFKRFAISYSPRKYEVKQDRLAVDLMVNAGYDPVAIITILNKTTAEPCWFEHFTLLHTGNVRMAYIYDYIYEKYPIYLAENKYFENLYYQNFLINSREEREKTRIIKEHRLKKNYRERKI